MNNISNAAPVTSQDRVNSVDVLRGVALLGILIINIEFFALPEVILFNPSVVGGFDGLDLFTWKFSTTLFLSKMMGIFSMLFGAGLALMFERFEAKGLKLGGIYYRRILWLLIFGLIHSYLIWYGDILVTYAICGVLLFVFRRKSPRFLIIFAAIFFFVGILIQFGSGYQFNMLHGAAEEVAQAEATGKQIEPYKYQMAEAWEEMSSMFEISEDDIANEVEGYKGGYLNNLETRVPQTIMMHTQALGFLMFWRAMGLMLLGMAFLKMGILSALKSNKFYIILGAIGFVIGIPLSLYATNGMIETDFSIIHQFMIYDPIKYISFLLIVFGHISVVMLLYKSGMFKWLRHSLSCVGRMALTNYLLASIICTTIFYGFGLGLFNNFSRFELIFFIFPVWIIQLVVSPWWLKRYKFGPAEWLWRSLTYWKKQPMMVQPQSTLVQDDTK